MTGKQKWLLALTSLILALHPEHIDGSSEATR